MNKNYWLHIIPISHYASSEPTARFLLVGNEMPHPGGAAPSRGYVSWEQLEKALREIAKIDEGVLQKVATEVQKGVAFTIPNVQLQQIQMMALGLTLKDR